MTTTVSGGGGGGGKPPFSGAAIDNINAGITLINGISSSPHFVRTLYDTDSYVDVNTRFVIPKQGYYAVRLSFSGDAPFVGHYEIVITGMNGPTQQLDANSVSGQDVNDFLYVEAHFDVLANVASSLMQSSGADQLVYPEMRIHYLGS